jgi:tetratricopeptide (TPR) repeat protein
MSAERTAARRAADKLLRLGKLQPAIAAYVRLVEEDPRDHEAALTLASLHLRARDVDAAVAQFTAVADALCLDGENAEAFQLYQRVLSLREGDEHALRQSAALASADGRGDEARGLLVQLADQQLARGDLAAATDTLADAAALDPTDIALRERVFDLAIESGQIDRAREHASTAAQCRQLADALRTAGRMQDAVELLRDAVRHDPDHLPTVAHLARLLVEEGNAVAAAEHLTPGMAGSDPEARLAMTEVLLRGGRSADALELARRTLADDPETVDAIARLASLAAPHVPEVAIQLAEMAVQLWTERSEWEPAAAALQQFVARAPGCIEALIRLVEVAVDGDLVATASHAQEMLADAYLATGSFDEGLAIAEDLAAREPDNPVHLARLRQAHELARGEHPHPASSTRPAPTILPFRVSAAS